MTDCDHFQSNGSWNDCGHWWCRECRQFIRWLGDALELELSLALEDREDLRAITTHREP